MTRFCRVGNYENGFQHDKMSRAFSAKYWLPKKILPAELFENRILRGQDVER